MHSSFVQASSVGGLVQRKKLSGAAHLSQYCILLFSGKLSLGSLLTTMCRKFVRSHFPTKRNTKADNLLSLKQQTPESAPSRASTGGKVDSGVEVPECMEMRDELLQQVSDLKLPPHFLDGTCRVTK